ncbi:MAG: hypothetical protein DRP85_01855 [Candidatus Makaraimicrobium thalassicum]|nr:MAG: hypothetical protein DRP85_01855 [Candidatus Omnitrophota bacterium]
MENIEELSNEELRELILEQLKDRGIDTEAIEVEIIDGPRVALNGKVDSVSEQKMIRQTITDMVGIDDIIDELVVIQDISDCPEDEGPREKSELYDQDKEYMGTEDAFQSVEDGVPYIPPTSPSYRESSKTVKWRKRPRMRI